MTPPRLHLSFAPDLAREVIAARVADHAGRVAELATLPMSVAWDARRYAEFRARVAVAVGRRLARLRAANAEVRDDER